MASINRRAIPLTIYHGDDQHEIDAPTKWVICYTCDGDGRNTYGDDSDEGHGDYNCHACQGTGKLLEIDHDTFRADDAELYAAWRENVRDSEAIDAMIASERRYGA